MVSTILAIDTSKDTNMLHMKVFGAIVLTDGALTMENEVNRPTVSTLKGVGLNLTVLPREPLHLLQDGVITEMRAREQRALQVIREYRINNEQMDL